MKYTPNGFSLTESLAAISVFFMITLTVIPILYQITLEEEVLKQRRSVQSLLHDELLEKLANISSEDLPIVFHKKVSNEQELTFKFHAEGNLVKGCANWQNVKGINETTCLYGYSER